MTGSALRAGRCVSTYYIINKGGSPREGRAPGRLGLEAGGLFGGSA